MILTKSIIRKWVTKRTLETFRQNQNYPNRIQITIDWKVARKKKTIVWKGGRSIREGNSLEIS